jgi:tetratricopeptide (TPR) repeat protein
MASLELLMGRPLQSERHLDEGDAILRPLLISNPKVNVHWKWRFIMLEYRVESCSALEQLTRCQRYVRSAVEVLARIEQANSLDPFERTNLANLHKTYGDLLRSRHRWGEALTAIEAARSLLEPLVRESEGRWEEAGNLLALRSSLAEVRLRLEKLKMADALSSLQQVARDAEPLCARHPYPRLLHVHSELLLRLARLQLEAGRSADSRESVGRAITILEALVKDHPERHNYPLALARALALRGELELREGRAEAALVDAHRAIKLLQPLVDEGSGYLFELGCLQAAYRALAGANPKLKAETLTHDSVCLATLRKAIDQGCDNADALRTDPRLARLRNHPDFSKLVAAAEAVGRTAAAEFSAEPVPKSGPVAPK